MGRILVSLVVFLPLCLALQDQRNMRENTSQEIEAPPEMMVRPSLPPLEGTALMRQHCLAILAGNSQAGFPGALAWLPLHHFGEQETQYLLQQRPWEFLQMCLARYDRDIQGYSTTFRKRERIEGKMQDWEIVECHFQEKPFRVYMNWVQGWRKAKKAIYPAGDNKTKILVLPAPPLSFLVVTRDLDSSESRQSGRFLISEFGMRLGTERTLAHMLKAKERNKLTIAYLGITALSELGNRPCYTYHRSNYDPPEDHDGVADLTYFIDLETWLQVGSILKDSRGEIIAEYYFRDVKINPSFHPDQFTRKKM